MAFNKLAKAPINASKIAKQTKNFSLQKIDNAVKSIDSFFEGKGKIITNADRDMVLIKSNKKIRFDIKDPHGDKPHFHVEKKNLKDKWVDAGPEHRYYFNEE